MNAKRFWIAGWIATSLLQWLAVLQPVLEAEMVLWLGQPYRFRLIPVDPSDPFRGRYVRLRFAPERAPWQGPASHGSVLDGYAALTTDSNGFAQVEGIASIRPSGDHLEVRLVWDGHKEGPRIQWPFERWYTSEYLAPELESAAVRGTSGTTTYAVVRVWRGRGAIEDLVVEGKSVRQWVRERAEVGFRSPSEFEVFE